jgi:hypothetical protein
MGLSREKESCRIPTVSVDMLVTMTANDLDLLRDFTRNHRLWNLLAQAQRSRGISSDQESELLRLRGEVGVLRKRTKDLEKLMASLPNASQTLKPEVAPEDNFPRAAWKFAGYATPEAAFESMILALSRGDVKAILASYDPELRKAQEKGWENEPEGQLRDKLINGTIQVTGFRILRRDFVSDDEVFLTVYIEGERGQEGKFRLRKLEDGWKADLRQFDSATGTYK